MSASASPSRRRYDCEARSSPRRSAEQGPAEATCVAARVGPLPPPRGAGRALLFFGCRSRTEDFLYGEEWAAHEASGTLQLVTAFSREQEHKVYVQHRMEEEGVARQLWQLLSAPDAHVYIAGAANQMPKAVRSALQAAAVAHGDLDEPAAEKLLQRLVAERRLQCETW